MNAHTKQQQDKVFETDFIDSQKPDPPFAHLLALSGINASKSLGQNYASAFNRFTVSSVAKFCDSELDHCHACRGAVTLKTTDKSAKFEIIKRVCD